MKIGILTFHDGPNHGAFLQAWATYRTLEREGHSVEIINYKNPRHHAIEKGGGLRGFLRNPIYGYGQWQKRRVFAEERKAFRMSPYVTSNQKLCELSYDTVVVGSDVVWNYGLFGYDPSFFGAVNAKRKVAFSASFGSIPATSKHPERMGSDLDSFDAIAVRDNNSREIVVSVSCVKPVLTLDPTLIYDFSQDLVDVATSPRPGGYLVVYSYLHSAAFIDSVRSHAKNEHLEVICVGYPPPLRAPRYCASIDMCVGPFEWIQLFANSQMIATSTFHGVVFSLKSKKPFIYIANDKAHNRVSSLLELCEIKHNLVLGGEGGIHFFDPDYSLVDLGLEPMAEFSRNWLSENV